MTAEEKLAAIKLHVEKAMAASREVISEFEDEDGGYDPNEIEQDDLDDIHINEGIEWLGEDIMKIINQ